MTRPLRLAVGLTIIACSPIVAEPPPSTANQVLAVPPEGPPTRALRSQSLSGITGCGVTIPLFRVTSFDPAAAVLAQVFLNKGIQNPSPTGSLALNLGNGATQLPLAYQQSAGGPPFAFEFPSTPLQLDNNAQFLFPVNGRELNTITAVVSDGKSNVYLNWPLDLTACDPRPF
jgi:hypothetical protein